MQQQFIINELEKNAAVFESMLHNAEKDMYLWKPATEKWNLLEIVCHLYDEEREDFRARVQHILEQPGEPMPPIDPVGWVSARQYALQDHEQKLSAFLEERKQSVSWLRSLTDPHWENAYEHPKLGPMRAGMILANWLAHDLLHMRQITRNKYQYLGYISKADLSYAGNW